MNKFYLFAAISALLLSFTDCSDNDSNGTEKPSAQTQDQYLIMFYGAGAENLDGIVTGGILRSLNVGSSDKVKMTYEYRYSKSYQDNEKCKNILRFTADENKQLVGKVNRDSTLTSEYSINTFENNVQATHFGSPDYVMVSDTALTSFIKWSKAQYPNAKKTVLIINDHGGGWVLYNDGAKDVTRGIIYDDNTNKQSLSLEDVKTGIANAGNVDLLFTDACLMSMWEDLVGYSKVTKFFIGSYEVAPDNASDYAYLINKLNDAELTDDALYNVAADYVDYIVDEWWPKYNTDPDGQYTDIAAYDLRKIDEPLNVVSDITKALVEKYSSDDDIPGVSADDIPLTKWKSIIDQCITMTESSSYFIGDDTFSDAEIPEAMFPLLDSLGYKKIYDEKEKATCYRRKDVLRVLKLMDYDMIMKSSDLKKYYDLWTLLAMTTNDSYCLSDLLTNICNIVKTSGSTDNTFSLLHERYINALQDFGHIRCTLPDKSVNLYEYNLCSPGIFIFPLNEKSYSLDDEFCFRYARFFPTAAEALKCYQVTDFDKATHWSEFLKVLEVAPNIITNPSREEI